MCDRLGYPEALREEEFPVWHGDLTAEIACFAVSARMDMSTATIVAGAVSGDRGRTRHFDAARALAAPICLLRSPDAWEVFSVQAELDPTPLSSGPPPDENPALARFLAPDALLAAKREPQQLSMLEIDIGLLDTARGIAGRELDRRVRSVVAGLLGDAQDEATAENAARLVVRALTALAVRDKLTADRSLETAIARVQELSPSYWHGGNTDQIVGVAEHLGNGLNFRTLDPALLGDVYERAVLIPAKRLALGAYYTPPEIGRKILDQLPLEEVEPSQRRFLDPSCGSGTLLLAANDRLMSAFDDEASDHQRHAYALERLVGSDNDPFAVEIARLALFLQALPYGNGYRVDQANALREQPSEISSTFSVSNPPWGYERREGQRSQRADAFLRRLVARTETGGFMACVLPVSWLTDDTSRDSRAWLREHADIFEIWRLPTRSFRSSTMAPCVVFAQIGQPSRHSYRYVNVWNRGRTQFLEKGRADEVVLSSPGSGKEPLTANWMDALPELSDVRQLQDVAIIRNGAPLPSIDRLSSEGPHLLFRRYGDVRPFGVVEQSVTERCHYPNDFSKRGAEASPALYLQPKILVSAMSSVDDPWRLRAWVDPIGVIPRNSMYAVVPTITSDGEDILMLLLGLLSSAVASLWIAQRSTTRMMNARSIGALPVPPPNEWPRVASAARAVVDQQKLGKPLDEAVRALDKAVFEAFSFSEPSIKKIEEALAGQPAPEKVTRFKSALQVEDDVDRSKVRRAGSTIDAKGEAIKVEVPGATENGGCWLENPPNMPGWLARPGAKFDVFGADGELREASFRYQTDSWMTIDELLAEFG